MPEDQASERSGSQESNISENIQVSAAPASADRDTHVELQELMNEEEADPRAALDKLLNGTTTTETAVDSTVNGKTATSTPKTASRAELFPKSKAMSPEPIDVDDFEGGVNKEESSVKKSNGKKRMRDKEADSRFEVDEDEEPTKCHGQKRARDSNGDAHLEGEDDEPVRSHAKQRVRDSNKDIHTGDDDDKPIKPHGKKRARDSKDSTNSSSPATKAPKPSASTTIKQDTDNTPVTLGRAELNRLMDGWKEAKAKLATANQRADVAKNMVEDLTGQLQGVLGRLKKARGDLEEMQDARDEALVDLEEEVGFREEAEGKLAEARDYGKYISRL